jgi:malate synthase
VRASVQIEAITAAYEMDEILYELRESATALNAGRWDYLFNLIKRLGHRPEAILPDRDRITPAASFLRAYGERLVQTAHRRGAHAIGGTSTLVPTTAEALLRVQAEKEREAEAGYDGSWVAHHALVAPARAAFDRRRVHGGHLAPAQAAFDRAWAHGGPLPPPEALLDLRIPGAGVTMTGMRANIAASLQYISAWLTGRGTVVRGGAVEDTATAELARTQLWQWIYHRVRLDDGSTAGPELYRALCAEESADPRAREVLDHLVLAEECPEFLPCVAEPFLEGGKAR